MTSKFLVHAPLLVVTAAALLASNVPGMAAVLGASNSEQFGYSYVQYDPWAEMPNLPYLYGSPDTAWCEQHYRSFNPATGTYLGYDGRQHACSSRGIPFASLGFAYGYAGPSYPNGASPYPYGAPVGSGRPPGVLPRDRVASPPRGNPDLTWQNATTEPF